MSNTEALRLADAMTHYFDERGPDAEEVAAELRRLHAKCEALTADTLEEMDRITEIHRLRALNAELVEALRCADAMLSGANMDAKAVERKVSAALAKMEASK